MHNNSLNYFHPDPFGLGSDGCPWSFGFPGAGTCDFDPERNCLKHEDCGDELKLCCSVGCGKECVSIAQYL